MKRISTLDKNIQKSYSLVLGQCTDLLKSKLKQINEWHVALTTYDVLIPISIIRTITLKFDEQKYLPIVLHQAKEISIISGNEACPTQSIWRNSTTLSTF